MGGSVCWSSSGWSIRGINNGWAWRRGIGNPSWVGKPYGCGSKT